MNQKFWNKDKSKVSLIYFRTQNKFFRQHHTWTITGFIHIGITMSIVGCCFSCCSFGRRRHYRHHIKRRVGYVIMFFVSLLKKLKYKNNNRCSFIQCNAIRLRTIMYQIWSWDDQPWKFTPVCFILVLFFFCFL